MPRARGRGTKRPPAEESESEGEEAPPHKRGAPAGPNPMDLDDDSIAREVMEIPLEEITKMFPLDARIIPELSKLIDGVEDGNRKHERAKHWMEQQQRLSGGGNGQPVFSTRDAPDEGQSLLRELSRSQKHYSKLQKKQTNVRKVRQEQLNRSFAYLLRKGHFQAQVQAEPEVEEELENPLFDLRMVVSKKTPLLNGETLPEFLESALHVFNQQKPEEERVHLSAEDINLLSGLILEERGNAVQTMLRPEIKPARSAGGKRGLAVAPQSSAIRSVAAAVGRSIIAGGGDSCSES